MSAADDLNKAANALTEAEKNAKMGITVFADRQESWIARHADVLLYTAGAFSVLFLAIFLYKIL